VPNSSPKKRKPPVSHPVRHIAQVIFECGGITRDAARKLKMADSTVRAYIKKYPSCREAREEALIDLKSIATDNLIDLVKKDRDKQATFFVLTRFRMPDGTWVMKKDEDGDESEGPEEPITIG
jgi:hypothetical protein